MHHSIPGTDPIVKYHLGHVWQQVGDFVPPGGIDVDPQGTLKRYPGRFEAVERAVQSEFPFLKLGFDLLHRSWVWYRVDRENIPCDFGGGLGLGGYTQEVATIVQPATDAMWETRKCDRENTVVHAYREPTIGEDMALLEYIASDHPEQLAPKSFGRWVGNWLRKDLNAREDRRRIRCHDMAEAVVQEWSKFVEPSDLSRFKPSIVVPQLPKGMKR